MILAIDKKGGLGNNNELLYYFKEDLQRFKDLTNGKTIVMGKNTWNSLPKKLPNRKNVVFSKSSIFDVKQPDLIINTKEELIKISKESDVWIIGGYSMYKEFIKYVDTIELTLIHAEKDNDVSINLEKELLGFNLVEKKEITSLDIISNNYYKIDFLTYERKNKNLQTFINNNIHLSKDNIYKIFSTNCEVNNSILKILIIKYKRKAKISILNML